MKKYIAEFFGTALLTLGVLLSLSGNFPVSTPVLAALIVGLLVYTMGHLSGTHINPAVTIAAFSLKKMSAKDAGFYIVAQFIGALVGLQIAKFFTQTPLITVENSSTVFMAEAIGTFVLMFAIASVIHSHIKKSMFGIVIGSALLIGISMAALGGSNAILNPAVALGLGSFNLTYLISPIVGAVAGAWFYKKVFA